MTLSLIAAVSANGVIGSDGHVPWYLPEDLEHFRRTTTGHTVIMGRKTFESVKSKIKKPLPNRTNVVITRQPTYQAPPGVEVYHDVASAIAAHASEPEVFIIGGGEIYRQTIDQANTLYITHVHQTAEGETTFPPIDPAKWQAVDTRETDAATYVTYRRNQPNRGRTSSQRGSTSEYILTLNPFRPTV